MAENLNVQKMVNEMHPDGPKRILISSSCAEGAHSVRMLAGAGKPLLQRMVLVPGW